MCSFQSSQKADGDDDDPADAVEPEEPAAAVDVLQVELALHGTTRLVEVQALVAGVQGVVSAPGKCSLKSNRLTLNIILEKIWIFSQNCLKY